MLARENLFLDMRAAWGQSENDIEYTEGGLYRTGDFETTRWLVSATLTGNHIHGNWRVTPSIGVAYGHEEFDSFKNSLGQTVEGNEVNIGRVEGKIEIGYTWRVFRDGYDYGGSLKDAPVMPWLTIEPQLALSGRYNFDQDTLNKCNGCTYEKDETGMGVEACATITPSDNRWSLRAAGKYDGIGNDFQRYGESVWLNIPLHRD